MGMIILQFLGTKRTLTVGKSLFWCWISEIIQWTAVLLPFVLFINSATSWQSDSMIKEDRATSFATWKPHSIASASATKLTIWISYNCCQSYLLIFAAGGYIYIDFKNIFRGRYPLLLFFLPRIVNMNYSCLPDSVINFQNQFYLGCWNPWIYFLTLKNKLVSCMPNHPTEKPPWAQCRLSSSLCTYPG